ncbi:MAG: DNA-binding domain-containing protein, AraC-type [Clostridium sp. Maddingley MBC34-26]|nr:MAG: DNA-binding domain-containing protein, AraC-type [Clostridium sp. Maddingley MBC34-26]
MIIKKSLINKSIEYILLHIDEDISIEDVANHCNFSKYHFSRMFKEETGVSIYSFIKRIKMDQSAVSLKVEKNKTITDIGVNYG